MFEIVLSINPREQQVPCATETFNASELVLSESYNSDVGWSLGRMLSEIRAQDTPCIGNIQGELQAYILTGIHNVPCLISGQLILISYQLLTIVLRKTPRRRST